MFFLFFPCLSHCFSFVFLLLVVAHFHVILVGCVPVSPVSAVHCAVLCCVVVYRGCMFFSCLRTPSVPAVTGSSCYHFFSYFSPLCPPFLSSVFHPSLPHGSPALCTPPQRGAALIKSLTAALTKAELLASDRYVLHVPQLLHVCSRVSPRCLCVGVFLSVSPAPLSSRHCKTPSRRSAKRWKHGTTS